MISNKCVVMFVFSGLFEFEVVIYIVEFWFNLIYFLYCIWFWLYFCVIIDYKIVKCINVVLRMKLNNFLLKLVSILFIYIYVKIFIFRYNFI